MSEPFIAEVRFSAYNFAPRGWALCNGQLLPIAQNTALFSIIGTTYGGDGETTMGLPNFQGRAAMHAGHGPGLTSRHLGQSGGEATVTLGANQLPKHLHELFASEDPATTNAPAGGLYAESGENAYDPSGNPVPMRSDAMSTTGGQPHNNMKPYLGLYFIIALVGLYPSPD